MELQSIIICGVGGQGILLASDVLSDVLIDAGFDVKKSEVHGMSQRGGDVVSTVRYGEKVYSPIVGEDEADMILAFERLEALRTLKYLKKDGKLMINDFKWDPLPVATGTLEYPEDVFERVKRKTNNIQIVDAVKVAEELGNIRVANVYLLGVLAKEMAVKRDIWESVIKRRVPEKAVEVNLKAFDKGYSGN